MAEQVAAVAGGVLGALLLLFLVAIGIYFLWRKRCFGLSYEEIMNVTTPTPTEATGVVSNVSTALSQTRNRSLSFVIPPKFEGRKWVGLENALRVQEDSEPYSAPDSQSQSSFCSMGAAYPLGSLDPSLYKYTVEEEEMDFPEGHIGRIWFALEYEYEAERLVVSLMKVNNLPGISESCNPFVKMHLLPDERRYLQSKTKRKTVNPQFDENFVFQVSGSTVRQRILRFSVYHVDKAKKHHLLGQVLVPLKQENMLSFGKSVMWKDLEVEVLELPSKYGDVLFSLSYNDYLRRLTVVVLRAKGIQFNQFVGLGPVYVKVSLINHNRFIKCKKTTAVLGSDPVYNESFFFKLDQSELDTASLSFSIMQNVTEDNCILLGRVVVGPFMHARGRELEHWNEMINKPKEFIKKWHALSLST